MSPKILPFAKPAPPPKAKPSAGLTITITVTRGGDPPAKPSA